MATLSFNLSDELKAIVQARAAESGFATIEQYVEYLVRDDSGEREVDPDVEALLLARADGPSVEMDSADFANMRAKLKARLDAQAGPRP